MTLQDYLIEIFCGQKRGKIEASFSRSLMRHLSSSVFELMELFIQFRKISFISEKIRNGL